MHSKLFTADTLQWFEKNLGEPTAVQQKSWPAIASGQHVLVSAPTGTGKTLSAFLVFIDKMMEQACKGTLDPSLQLIYVSPLKSLAGDIRENLKRPLEGIAKAAGQESPLSVAIRTGDTTSAERRRMIQKPPHILITTPESLYLLLTAKSSREILKTAKAIVIDELHAVIGSKRGAHLMLSLARLDALCGRPLQRVGLSATIKPLELAADYLSNGDDKVKIVAPEMRKDFEIKIKNPIPQGVLPENTVWPEIAREVAEIAQESKSVIAFCEGRLIAEKLAYYVNQLMGEGFARTHHGSVSKERRLEVENDLRVGKLRLLCATSSMELGIDVGDIDQVLQVACPSLVSSLMQRLGRAGHNPGRSSLMFMFPRTVSESLYCALTAHAAREGEIEKSHPPRLCFDVLAQHLVSMANDNKYTVDDVMHLLPHAYPFREVSREDVLIILWMLAGDYEHERDIPVRPRLNYDRIHETVEGDIYSRMLAASSPGTIPDTGMYAVRTETGVKVGELEEEFVYEQRVGFKFLLGSFAWRITGINKDTVIVAPASTEGARSPFWRRQWDLGRTLQIGQVFGQKMRQLTEAAQTGSLVPELEVLGLNQSAAKDAADFIKRQIETTGILPDDRSIIVEHFVDEVGLHQIMIHSIFGRQINAPLAILLTLAAKNLANMDVDSYEDDDGILLMARGEQTFPEGLIETINPETIKTLLEAALPGTPMFNIGFRHNAGRALMMGVRQNKRNPLWVQRLRSSEMLDSVITHPEHPLIRETKRESLEDRWDLSGLKKLLTDISLGEVKVRELFSAQPSPMSLLLRRAAEAEMMYNYAPNTDKVLNTVSTDIKNATEESDRLKPNAVELKRVSERPKLPRTAEELHRLLMIEGDVVAGELDLSLQWFESLASQGRCLYIEPGLWIAAEQAEEYQQALLEKNIEARQNIVRRALRYRGAMDATQLSERYFWSEKESRDVLEALRKQGNVIEDDGLYYHAQLYERARRATIIERRQVHTMPGFHYAAFMARQIRSLAPPEEQLGRAIEKLADQTFPAGQWEGSLLPPRVSAYSPELLERLLSDGQVFWQLNDTELSFHSYEDVDWEASQPLDREKLDPDEDKILRALQRRGASFMSALSNEQSQINRPLQEVLFSLMEKGLVHADSFAPVRIWLERSRIEKSTARQRALARVATTTAGRWDICRSLQTLSVDEKLNRVFDRAGLLCRETAFHLLDMPWAEALEHLRVWEYTGRARRGYFIEGLSGAQYIRQEDYAAMIHSLENPGQEIAWLAAPDPNQAWGKILSHDPNRQFTSVYGTAVALMGGIPVAVFERQGATLRVFDESPFASVINDFADKFNKRHIFPALKRLTVKSYPQAAEEILAGAGFRREMQDYVLYRKIDGAGF